MPALEISFYILTSVVSNIVTEENSGEFVSSSSPVGKINIFFIT